MPERRWTAEPKNFVNLFCAVIYDLLWRILYAGEDVRARYVAAQRKSYPDIALGCQHGVHRTYRVCKPDGLAVCLEPESVLPLSIAISKVPSSNVKLRMSITSPEAAIRSDLGVSYDLADVRKRREEMVTLHFRPTVIPCDHLLNHYRRILRIREKVIRDHTQMASSNHSISARRR